MSGEDAGKITRAALKWVEDEGLLRQSILWQNKVREAFEAGAAFAQGSQATPPAEAIRQYDARPFTAMNSAHAMHVAEWMKSNNKQTPDVNWSLYPIGMVGRWIERAETAEGTLRNVMGEARGLMKVVCRMIWAREHGLRIGRDDANDGSAYVMRLAHVLGILPELNGAKFRDFCEQLTGLSFEAAAQPERPGPQGKWSAAMAEVQPCGHTMAQHLYHDSKDFILQPCDVVAPQSAPGPQWISVEERLPVEDRPVWMFNGMCGVAVYRQIDGWWLLHGAEEVCPLPNVTYWQELPAPPGSVAPPEAERQPASKVEILTHGDKWHDVTQPKAERQQEEK
jgi:hypothetical protein